MPDIVAHYWNSIQIRQTAEECLMGRETIPAGAVNLTEIAIATGKDVSQFLRLPSTKSFMEEYKNKHGIIPCFMIPGRNGGTWAMLPLAIKMCAWISPGFELWGMETLGKVMSGKEITNPDRAEGWAKAAAVGVQVPLADEAHADLWALVDGAIARGIDPIKFMNACARYAPKHKTAQEPPKNASPKGNGRDLRTLALEVISAAPERGLTHRDIYRAVYGLNSKSTAELVAKLESEGLVRTIKRKAVKGATREFIYPV